MSATLINVPAPLASERTTVVRMHQIDFYSSDCVLSQNEGFEASDRLETVAMRLCRRVHDVVDWNGNPRTCIECRSILKDVLQSLGIFQHFVEPDNKTSVCEGSPGLSTAAITDAFSSGTRTVKGFG